MLLALTAIRGVGLPNDLFTDVAPKVLASWRARRVAGSLVTNQVRAYDLLRMFGRHGRPTPLG